MGIACVLDWPEEFPVPALKPLRLGRNKLGPSPSHRQGLARDAEAFHIGRGALSLALRIDSELFGPVAIDAIAAIGGPSDFRRDRRPRLSRELELERIVDLRNR